MSEQLIDREIIQSDYREANKVYSDQRPVVIGRLTLSQSEVRILPLDLTIIYRTVFESIASDRFNNANLWAARFGALSICVALDGRETEFKFDDAKGYKSGKVAEIQSNKIFELNRTFYAEEQDSPIAFVLNDEAQTVEMSLVEALHMVDFGLARGNFTRREIDNLNPLVVCTSFEQLIKLRRDNPSVMLRIYGNVRGLEDAPDILGTVVSTKALEASGIDVRALNQKDASPNLPNPAVPKPREPAAVIGITTAKRPHIGHAFLLVKAITEAGNDKKILLELNDLGPRVAEAVSSYASKVGTSFEEAARKISGGEVTHEEIEQAYRERKMTLNPLRLQEGFSLKASNNYYRQLFSSVCPSVELVANSELSNGYKEDLLNNANALQLFGGSGMALLSHPSNQEAVVVELSGELRVAGILGALSTRYALTQVDSPKPLDQKAAEIFEATGLGIAQVEGMGVSFDFIISSGSNGNTLLIEDLLKEMEARGFPPSALPSVCLRMLREAYFVPGQGSSLNPNYASPEAAFGQFRQALADFSEEDFSKKLEFVKVDKSMAVEILDKALAGVEIGRKPTPEAINQLLKIFPDMPLATDLVQYARLKPNATMIPRNFTRSSSQTWSKLFSKNPKFIFEQIGTLAKVNPEITDDLLNGTELQKMMVKMGYGLEQIADFFAKLKEVKNVYKLQ